MPDQKTMWTRCLGGLQNFWFSSKKKVFLPKNDHIWPKIGIFDQDGPGHAGLFGALLVGRLVVVARGLYLARHLFTLWTCLKFAKQKLFTHICREFEKWRDLHLLSRKFFWQKSCHPESFQFFWLCSKVMKMFLYEVLTNWKCIKTGWGAKLFKAV